MSTNWPNEYELTEEQFYEYELTEKNEYELTKTRANRFKYELTWKRIDFVRTV